MGRQQDVAARAERLTETQRQCLILIYKHMTSKEIAPVLGLSPHSVDAHIRIAMKVLGVDNRREAALAYQQAVSAHSARQKPVGISYKSSSACPQATFAEPPAPAWEYPSDASNMVALQERSRNTSAIKISVEQSGSTSAVSEPVSKSELTLDSLFGSPAIYNFNMKVIMVLMIAVLSAMAFGMIASGFAALTILFSG